MIARILTKMKNWGRKALTTAGSPCGQRGRHGALLKKRPISSPPPNFDPAITFNLFISLLNKEINKLKSLKVRKRGSGRNPETRFDSRLLTTATGKKEKSYEKSGEFACNSSSGSYFKNPVAVTMICDDRKPVSPIGVLAQLARALAWHARGQGFKSLILHHFLHLIQ